MAVFGPDLRITHLVGPVERVLGFRPEVLIGTTALEWIHPDDLEAVAESIASLVHSDAATAEVRFRHADGGFRWMEGSGVNLLDHPEIRGLACTFRDVSDRKHAELARRESDERFRALVQNASDIVEIIDAHGFIRYISPAVGQLGYRPEDLIGTPAMALVHPDDQARSTEALVKALQSGDHDPSAAPEVVELRVLAADGQWRWIEIVGSNQLDNEAVQGIVINFRDVTERKQTVEALQQSEALFRALVHSSRDVTLLIDRDTRITYASPSAKDRFGWEPAELVGRSGIEFVHPDDVPEALSRLARLIDDVADETDLVTRLRDRSGNWRWTESVGTNLLDVDGIEALMLTVRDITERKELEAELEHQATHDPLTGLPNRALLLDRLGVALARGRRRSSPLAVLFVDVDNFKVVNDSLGHDRGDRILVELAGRLAHRLRDCDTVARFGGDEFVVLCEDLEDENEAVAVAERLRTAATEPFVVDGIEVFVTLSIGISHAPRADARAESLVRDADAAMYEAKERGRDRTEVFDGAMRARLQERLETESALRRALERGELLLHYQPTVSLLDGTITGVEALVRWEHPERGLLGPAEFVPLAECTGLIVPIGAWVLEQACRQLVRWRTSVAEAADLAVSVNVSGRQLVDADFPARVEAILDEAGADPAWVQLELTESILMDDPDAVVKTLEALRRTGVTVAVDDFGTGYSSLAYLKRFPTQSLKIDRTFIAGIGRSHEDSTITTAVIRLAHTLGLEAVAEGVEDAEQLVRLRDAGCDLAQGFYFSRPLPAADLEQLLRSHPRW